MEPLIITNISRFNLFKGKEVKVIQIRITELLLETLKFKKMKNSIKLFAIVVFFIFLLLNLLTTREVKAVAPVAPAFGEETIWCPHGADRIAVYRCKESGDGCCISCQQTCYD